MSSKFSNRPAVRKRPWICKTSPPALPVPDYPPSVYATVYMLIDKPFFPYFKRSFTILLTPTAPLGPYAGTWTDGTDHVDVAFNWVKPATAAAATITWLIASYPDAENFPQESIRPWPSLAYRANILTSTTGLVRASIDVTN